jgi:hypothetical protein
MLRFVTANRNAKTTKNSFRCLIFDIQKVLDFLQDELCFYQAQCKNTERGTRTLQNMTKQWIRLIDFLSSSACVRSKSQSCGFFNLNSGLDSEDITWRHKVICDIWMCRLLIICFSITNKF